MRVRIWGARGSIPTPLRPEEIKEKFVLAVLGMANMADEDLKQRLVTALFQQDEAADPAIALKIQRQVVESYLDRLPGLLGSTASGNTPCVEIQVDQDLFIIDAGSGIRDLGLELMQGECGQGKGVIHLLFSHPHWDHIQGFPFFRPAFIPGNQIFIYSVHDLEAVLRRQQEPVNFPVSVDYMQADMTFIRIKPEETLEFGDLRIRCIRNEHPGDSYAFRFEKGNRTFVYASDAAYPAGLDLRPYLNFFAEADVLIYDAQFTQRESDEKEDWGHSSSFVGVEMAQQAGVKKLVLFHYDPTYSDSDLERILEDTLRFQQSQYADQTPVEVMMAVEGQTFDLRSTHSVQLQQVPGSKVATLIPSGIFDERVVTELREQLFSLKKFDGPTHIVVDMSGVERLQLTGLRALVKLSKEQANVSISLAGATTAVQQLVELAGYSDFFTIYPSLHAAINTLQAHETLNLPGQMIKNRYYIEAKMGDGRLGTVFKATDTRLNRPVAIKILSHAFSEGAIEQFLQYGRQIVELVHPNIVTVYECDRDRGLSFMVEELIESRTLRDLLDANPGQPLPFQVALNLAENISRALEYAHGHDVIHGDLKPKNVLLADEVKISDIGLGRLESGKSLLAVDSLLDLVTADYLAPEQVLGHPIDARTDLYALGVILYELFTGQRPFAGSDQEVLEQHRRSKPTSPRQLNPALSMAVEHLILKLLDKDPNKRYANARQTRRILASMTWVTSGEAQPAAFVPPQRRPLIGRQDILQQLLSLWRETEQGQGRFLLISGRSGSGKTRLLQEFAQQIKRATLLIGSGQKREGGPAFQPIVEAVTDCAMNPVRLSQSLTAEDTPIGQLLGRVASLFPEVQSLYSSILDPDQGEAFPKSLDHQPPKPAGFVEALREMTADRPWLLILDDLHRCDQSSLKLLRYLADYYPTMRLMIVGTYQDDDIEENKPLAELLEMLDKQPACRHFRVRPFTEDEVTKFLGNIWFQPAPADLTAAIYRRTKGNPLYIEEIAKLLTDEGVVSWRGGQWHFEPVVEASLPRHVRETVLRRIDRLPRRTQTILNQAAILGPTFTFTDLLAISEISSLDLLESLDVLLERQLIRQAAGEMRLHFSHFEFQQALYGNMTALKRGSLHREAGEALEQNYGIRLDNVVEELAYHFFQAGELEKAFTYSIQAARRAETLYAHHTALAWYTPALDALEQLEVSNETEQQRFEVLLARERINNELGNRPAQAADLASLERLAGSPEEPAKQAIVHNRQATYNCAATHLDQAIAEADAGLAAARQAGDPRLEGESLLQLACIASSRGRFDPARVYLDRAMEVLTAADNPDGQARVLAERAVIARYVNNFAEAEALCRQALSINQAINNRAGQAAALNLLGILHLDKGEFGQALIYFRQLLAADRMIGRRQAEADCLHYLATTYKELGQLELADDHIQAALAIRFSIQDQLGKAKDRGVLGTIHVAREDYKTGRDYAGEALEVFQRLGLRPLESKAWLELGMAQESLGDLAKAEAAYSQAQIIQQELGNAAGVLDSRAGLARCLLAGGKTGKAQKEIEIVLAELKTRGATGLKHPIRLYLTAYWVLQAANLKEKAVAVLREGWTLLEQRADAIAEADLRTSFIEEVSENKEFSIQLQQYDE